MKKHRKISTVSQFFKDKHGKWAVTQSPNALLLMWLFLFFVNLAVNSRPLTLLQSAILFAWAYLELTQGVSYFRRALGAIFLTIVAVGYFA